MPNGGLRRASWATCVSNIRWSGGGSVRSQSGVSPGCLLGLRQQLASSSWSARKRSLQVRQRSEEHTSELQSRENLVCRLLLEKKKKNIKKKKKKKKKKIN